MNKRHQALSLRLSSFIVLFLAVTLFNAAPTLAAATTFSGQGTVVKANVAGFAPIVLADTQPLPAEGGSQEASLLGASVPGLLTAQVLHASTIGQGDRSRSEASVAKLDLTVAGNTIGAEFLMARASAVCNNNGTSSVSGSSELAELVINGQTIAVTGEPNQTVLLPGGGKVVINEQSGDSSSITVTALHVIIPGIADVAIATAHADVHCGSSSCSSAKDFVTGGGWISPPAPKANFAVAGGLKNGALWGHLLYIDHGTGMKVKGTGVTAYVIGAGTARHIEGTCEINGVAGTYSVDVADNGEPGRNLDTFSIKLPNYTASGLLAGGNIQLHGPCK